MTEREKILSNDYYDLIADYTLPGALEADLLGGVYQPVGGEIGVVYLSRETTIPMSVSNFTYPVIPKIYGLMQITAGEGLGLSVPAGDETAQAVFSAVARTGEFDPSALTKSGITQVQESALGLMGRGVVIGFLDTGIRYEEAVFRREDGSTRILGIWDQTIQTGTPPEGILYGTEYKRADIDRALQSGFPREIVPSYDENGHGTAIASVAAGSRLNGGTDFTGAAPEADIVMVKLREAKPYLKEFYLVPEGVPAYAESDILVALRYLESYARALTRPLVICFGLGTNLGDHEGHSVLAGFLNQIATRRSRAVVVCGGNEGNSAHHYHGTSGEGLTETTDNVEIRVDVGERGFVTELWGSIPAKHAISIRSPGGEITPKVDFRDQNSREFLFIFERSRIQVDHVLVESGSGEELIFFRFIDPTPGVWTIQVTISGGSDGSDFHMWLPITGFVQEGTYFLRPSPYTTLTEPSNVREVITTTTFDDRNNSFWAESGRGYTRMGQIKPDFCTPGVNVSTVLGKRTGSSIAVAIAAGASALFLEWAVVEGNQPRVESRELKNYLIRGAQRPPGGNTPNREWGYGRLDLVGAFYVLAGV